MTKPLLGHIKKFNGVAVKRIREFRDFSKEVKPGDVVGATVFAPGDYVDAIGVTKGRGFEGVVGRHAFRGRRLDARRQGLAPALRRHRPALVPRHGHARHENARPHGPGARTTQNLEVIQVREADNLLLIKGAIPGAQRRLRGYPRIQEAPQGLETACGAAGEHQEGETKKK